jgi:hypothetical protein
MVRDCVERKADYPVLNAEVCYEGICGSCGHDIQRFVFWGCVLSGACGHTYGANGIWQVNSAEKAYGPSPHSASWGDTPWEEAYRLPGSSHVGIGKRIMEQYAWWLFESHPEWLDEHSTREKPIAPFAAGIPGHIRIIYLPIIGGYGFRRTVKIKQMETGIRYHACFVDPMNGRRLDIGAASADENGDWIAEGTDGFHDWLLILDADH